MWFATIEWHNRGSQGDLQFELKMKTMTWWKRVNLSVVGTCVVDAYLVFKSAACNESNTQRDIYTEL
jgi:hypothetical protein